MGLNSSIVYLSDYTYLKNGDDWIPAFTQAITDLLALGGGIVEMSAGTHYIRSPLYIPTNVNVVGVGMGITIIRLLPNVDSDMVIIDTSDNCGISNLSIWGNKSAGASSNKTGLILGRAGLSADNSGNMPNLCIQDLEIRDIGGNGFRCYRNTWVYILSRIAIRFCTGYGALIESTDNLYDGFYIHNNGKVGLYVTGSNNRFSNMKVIFNGSGSGLTTDIEKAGIYCQGRRNTFVNFDSQENYGHGYVFNNAYDTDLIGCLSDANGYSAIANGTNIATASGFYFTNCTRFSGILKAANFKAQLTQKNGYVIEANCVDLCFDYENDRPESLAADINNSASSIVITAKKKVALYGVSAWENWAPSLRWTNATPIGVTTIARRKIIGKTVFFALKLSATDGNGATGLNIKLPSDMLPKNNSLQTPFYNNCVVGTTTTVRQVNLRDDGVNNDINFGFMGTATASQPFKVQINGTYELA